MSSAQRRPSPDAFTVVNAYAQDGAADPVFVKTNCLHCNQPACVSACIVGALRKQENGAVTYDAWKCIGCRYCMVACPFQVPAYSYDDAFTPAVRKCQFCFHRVSEGTPPGCVAACPRQTMIFDRRSKLLTLARERLARPDRQYVQYIYGEHEVGGTSWLYLSNVPFERAGFLKLPLAAPPVLTEKIQHSVFKYGLPPLLLYGTLGAVMYLADPHRRGRRMAAAAPVTADPPRHAQGRADHAEAPLPVQRKLLTPGVLVLLGLMAAGFACMAYRFLFGIGASTNLDQQHPWGLWIAIDVASGVALAAGGFTSAFLTHILHREHYHAIARPALLTAMLGYTFVVIGLQADLGRYYNVWHPLIMWQGNSVLFEVGMCVMCYLNVLYLEFMPIACERVMQHGQRFPRLARLAEYTQGKLGPVMFLLVIAGCCLSCLHQSSLGNLMVIAPSKLHPLWWTPLSPALFLLSAMAVGFPMVIWESLFAGWSLRLKPEMHVLGPLARFIPWTLGVYLAAKIGDMIWRGSYVYLLDGSLQSICWMAEIGLGVVLPLVMLSTKAVRRSPLRLFTAVTLIVLGVVFNRVNVFLIGYRPPYASHAYVPSLAEISVTVGLIACLMFAYRVIVTYFPVISQHKTEGTA